MNFGLWLPHSASAGFSAACAALARAVADAARIPRRTGAAGDAADARWGVSVVDLGCGCGDQLRLWAAEYRVRSISACTPERPQVRSQLPLHPQILPLTTFPDHREAAPLNPPPPPPIPFSRTALPFLARDLPGVTLTPVRALSLK